MRTYEDTRTDISAPKELRGRLCAAVFQLWIWRSIFSGALKKIGKKH